MLKHCDCGCIHLEKDCPNCNRQSPQDRIKELEAKLAKAMQVVEMIASKDVDVDLSCEIKGLGQ